MENDSSTCGRDSAITLTEHDRSLIAAALELAALKGNALREHTSERDLGMAMAQALGEAQHVLRELAAALERLGGQR